MAKANPRPQSSNKTDSMSAAAEHTRGFQVKHTNNKVLKKKIIATNALPAIKIEYIFDFKLLKQISKSTHVSKKDEKLLTKLMAGELLSDGL